MSTEVLDLTTVSTSVANVESIDPKIEVFPQALNIMTDMFGEESVSSVKELSMEFSQFINRITEEEGMELLKYGGIGTAVGFTVGVVLTYLMSYVEKKSTGNWPVPSGGIGCALIPKTAFLGGCVGTAVKLWSIYNGGG